MKLKSLIGSLCLINSLLAAGTVLAADPGLRYITTRGTIRCGSDLQAKNYAYKDEDGFWHGFDAEMCKVFSQAIFGRPDRFTMVDVSSNDIPKALSTNKVDIMFGAAPFEASTEIANKAMPADVMYYDQQMFLARKIDGATSMQAYKGAKVCVVPNTDDYNNLQNYSDRYKLDLVPLNFQSRRRATEAFLLNRCQMLTGNAIYLNSILKHNFAEKDNVVILPESIAIKPTYALVAKDNNTLRIVAKWIFNALKLSEEYGIDSKNIKVFIGSQDLSQQNLLGDNPALWNKFGLSPNWVRNTIADQGNYGEIYERNIGADSPLQMERRENNLLKNGGLLMTQPFL